MRIPQAPLFRDPIFNGAADPTLIWNHKEEQWWMVYTQRRATSPGPGVTGVHGSDLGVASSPDGHDWLYRGTIPGLEFEPGRNTWWAPEILYRDGLYHMYVSYVQGMPVDWNRPRQIIHYTAQDLWRWELQGPLSLNSERVIDACVAELPGGGFRMWFKDECDESYSHYADSADLYHWREKGRATDRGHHEGVNVFKLGGAWWYIGDFWKGQGIFKSDDCENWAYQGLMLDQPGTRPDDGSLGHHADVVVQGDEAYIFYFTHPERDAQNRPLSFTAVQVARLTTDGKTLFCDRDEAFDFCLARPDI